MKKRLAVISLIIFMFVVAIGMLSFGIYAENPQKIVIIENENDLLGLISSVGNTYEDTIIELRNDIYMSRFNPFATSVFDAEFKGTFNGNGHAIVGLELGFNCFFFNKIGKEGSVNNLSIVDYSASTKSNFSTGLAYINLGTISNVRVESRLYATTDYIAGLTYINGGVISDCFAAITIDYEASASTFGISYINVGLIVGESSATIDLDSIGIIKNSDYFVMDEAGNLINGVLTNTAYTEEETDYYGTVIDDGIDVLVNGISDYFDILYYQKHAGDYISIEQTAIINLFNQNKFSMNDISANVGFSALYGVYNNDNDDYEFDADFDGDILSDVTPSAQLFANPNILYPDGSKENPYLINSVADFLAIENYDFQYDEEDDEEPVYFMLTKSLCLYEGGTFYDLSIESFYGVIDFASFAVFEKHGSPLIKNNYGTIKNLYIRGSFDGLNALVTNNNYGTIDVVNVFGIGSEGAAIVIENYGEITNSMVDGTFSETATAVATKNAGRINRVRNQSSAPFINEEDYTDSNKGIFNSIDKSGSLALLTANNSIYFDETEGYLGTNGKTVEQIVRGSYYSELLINTGFAYVRGVVENIPVLVFSSDRIKYKALTRSLNVFNTNTEYDPAAIYTLNTQPSLDRVRLIDKISGGISASENAIVTIHKYIDDVYTQIFDDIFEVGTYYVGFIEPSTENASGQSVTVTFTISQRRLVYTYNEFKHIVGVVERETSTSQKIYDGEVTYTSDFVPNNFPSGIYLNVSVVGGQEIKDAGLYNINFSATNPNYLLYFNFGGGTNYINAGSLLFKIEKAELTVSLNAGDYLTEIKYLDNITILRYNLSGFKNSDDETSLSVSIPINLEPKSSYSSGTKIGNYSFTIGLKSGVIVANYTIVSASYPFTVIPKNIDESVSISPKEVTYNGKYHKIEGQGLDGIAVTYDIVCKPLNAAETKIENVNSFIGFIDAGDYIYKMKVTANENYNPKDFEEVRLRINPKQLTVTANDILDLVYPEMPTFSATTDGIVNRDDLAPTGVNAATIAYDCAYPQNDLAGTFDITPKNLTHSPNYTVNYVKGTLVVAKTQANFTLVNKNVKYNGIIFEPNLIPTSAFDKSKSDIKYYTDDTKTEQIGAPTNAGKYYIVIQYSQTDNYFGGVFESEFEIEINNLNSAMAIYIDSEALSANKTVSYKGSTGYKIDINHNSLPTNESFKIKYRVFDGQEELYESDNPPVLVNIGVYTVKIYIAGNANYNALTLESKVITINPLSIRIDQSSLNSLRYTGLPLSVNIPFVEGYEPLLGDEALIDLTAFKSGIETEFKNAGAYSLVFYCSNQNYSIYNNTMDVTVKKAVVNIDLNIIGAIVTEFGLAYPEHSTTLTYSIGDYSETDTITFIVSGYTFGIKLPANLDGYDITAAEENDNVEFKVLNGLKKLIVNPKTLQIDWNSLIPADIYYKGELWDITITDNNFADQKPSNDPIRLTFSVKNLDTNEEFIRNSGDYVATLSVGSRDYRIEDLDKTFNFTIEKLDATFTIDKPQNITYMDDKPSFTAIFNQIVGEDTNEAYSYQFVIDYTKGDDAGEYKIDAIVESQNYNVVVVVAYLTVEPAALTGITIVDQTIIYASSGANIVINGVPNGAKVGYLYKGQYYPKFYDVGVYDVVATIELKNYQTVEIPVVITINKATPSVVVQTDIIRLAFAEGVTEPPLSATATFEGNSVAGQLVFASAFRLKFGINEYDVKFVPDSGNLNTVSGLKVKIEGYLLEETVTIDLENYDEDIFVIEDDKPFVIKLSQSQMLLSQAKLYVNGKHIPDGYLEIIGAVGEVNIEIIIDGKVYYSKTVNIVEELPPTMPDDDEKDENNDENQDGNRPDSNAIYIIIGVIGGVVLVVLLFFIIKSKISKKGYKKAKTNK